jgi:hypothetical protein
MKRLLLAGAMLAAFPITHAGAVLVSFCGPSSGMGCETAADKMVFLQAAKGVTQGFGNIGSQTGLPLMEFSSDHGLLNITINLANGFATITPTKPAVTFNGLDISIPGFEFKDLVFDEQLTPNAAGPRPFTITARDTLGTVVDNTFDAADTDKEWSVTALLGAFKDINIQAPGGFDEMKHFEVGGLIAIPEPRTWAMMLIGFGLMAGLGYRRTWTARRATSSMA